MPLTHLQPTHQCGHVLRGVGGGPEIDKSRLHMSNVLIVSSVFWGVCFDVGEPIRAAFASLCPDLQLISLLS